MSSFLDMHLWGDPRGDCENVGIYDFVQVVLGLVVFPDSPQLLSLSKVIVLLVIKPTLRASAESLAVVVSVEVLGSLFWDNQSPPSSNEPGTQGGVKVLMTVPPQNKLGK